MHCFYYKWLIVLVIFTTTAWSAETTPSPKAGYFPIVVLNSTTQETVYFTANGKDTMGFPCFITPVDPSTGAVNQEGICHLVYPSKNSPFGSYGLSVNLKDLPTVKIGSNDGYLLYIPENISSRGYFSINRPLYLTTGPNTDGYMEVRSPSVMSDKDLNYYTLYQSIEFNYDQDKDSAKALLYINCSWVDYFCLPLTLSIYGYPDNQPVATGSFRPAGIDKDRSAIMTEFSNAVAPDNGKQTWNNLIIPFYNEPYKGNSEQNTLRILAPKSGFDFTPSFSGSANPVPKFPKEYFFDSSAGPVAGQNFFEWALSQMTGRPLYLRITPAGIDSKSFVTIVTCTYNRNDLNMDCKAETKDMDGNIIQQYQGAIDFAFVRERSGDFTSGATWPFSGGIPVEYTNEISKGISSLWAVGQFPLLTTSEKNPIYISENQDQGTIAFSSLKYFANPAAADQGIWYNLYEEILHQQMLNQADIGQRKDLGIGYAYDYDDLIGLGGLINPMIQDQFGNFGTLEEIMDNTPYVVFDLKQVEDTEIPDIWSHQEAYKISFSGGMNGVSVSCLYYDRESNTQKSISVNEAQVLESITSENPDDDVNKGLFLVFETTNGEKYTFALNLKYQIAFPYYGENPGVNTPFSVVHEQFQKGIVFQKTPDQNEFVLAYNTSPLPWQG